MAEYPVSFEYVDFNHKTDPLVDGMEEGSDSSPASPVDLCAAAEAAAEEAAEELLEWGVETITLTCGAKVSTSFDDKDHTAVAAGKEAPERFYFAPTEDQVDVAWTLKNPEQMQDSDEVTLELYAYGGSAPVWQRTLKPVDAKKLALDAPWDGSFPEEEWVDTVSFPAQLVTAEYSPYMMKIRATGKLEEGLEERWTYFDVLVHGIELEWGPEAEKVLPIAVPDPDDGRRARHLYANEKLRDTADADNLSGLIPEDGENKLVPLKSNLFYQGESELRGAHNEFYTKYKDLWGNGAMIPIMVNAKICNAADAAVDVPAALGNVKYLWDYEDKATNDTTGIDAGIKTFLETVADYFTAESEDSPTGSNCHVNRGGKRGFGAEPVFPPQGGIDPVDTLPDPGDDAADFPFNVTQCADRKWCAISQSWTEGELAGKSGVIFRPSRMAGDAYALRISLFLRDHTEAVASAASDTETYPEELSAATGTFTVWQDVDIAKYVQIGAGTTPVDMDTVTADLAKFFVKLNYDPANLVDGTAQWDTGMGKIYPLDGALRTELAPYIQDALPEAAAGDTLIEFKTYAGFKDAWVARGGDIDAAYAQSAGTTNPTNPIGEQKYDWLARPQFGLQSYPFQQPWPIDHTNAVTEDLQGKVRVEFEDPKGGTHEHVVVFGTGKRYKKSKNVDVALADRAQFATFYDTCLRNNDGQYPAYRDGTDDPIVVNLYGKTSATNIPRLDNIRAALDEIVEDYWHHDDDSGGFYPESRGDALVGLGKNANRYGQTAGYEWIWNIIQLVLFDQFPATDGGIYLFQVGDVNMCNFHSPKAKAMFADEIGNKIISVLSKTAKWPTLEHEIGHCKFVNHTYVSDVGNDPLEIHQEDAAGACTMVRTGVGETNTFCGLCMLRMRGWSIYKVTAPATGAFDDASRMLKKDGTSDL